jgi:ubiquitin-protein ligase
MLTYADVCCASGSPYALGLYEFDVLLPDSYPLAPPLVKFITTGPSVAFFFPIFCLKISCLSLLKSSALPAPPLVKFLTTPPVALSPYFSPLKICEVCPD